MSTRHIVCLEIRPKKLENNTHIWNGEHDKRKIKR